MNKSIQVPVTYAIVKVVTDKFATYGDLEIDHNALSFYANINFRVNLANYSVRCTFDFDVRSGEKNFIEISTSVYFQIHEDSWVNLPVVNEKKEIPLDFAIYMGQVTVSTARGILHVKTEGSPLNDYFIPDLVVEDLVKTRLIIG